MGSDLTLLLDRLKVYRDLPLEEIRTLDPRHYTSDELYDLEIEHIWKKEWICVGHVCEFKKPGDFVAFDLIDEPMMVIRGEDMQLRAMSTVCRHRFMPIVRHGERGNASRFQCPYHRWTYGMDGRLKQALYMEENRAFDMDQVRMPEYRLEVWNDLIFVNLDDEADPLAPRLTDLEEAMAHYKVPADWEAPYHYDYTWNANWKLCVENNENYHSMGVHNDTVELTTPTAGYSAGSAKRGEYWVVTRWEAAQERQIVQGALERSNWKPGDMGQQIPGLDIGVIYPSNGITWGLGGPGWYTHWPVSVDETRAWQNAAMPPGDVDPEIVADPTKSMIHKVLNQDLTAFTGGIGWGVKSAKLQAGPLSEQEENVLRCHQWTAGKILEAVG